MIPLPVKMDKMSNHFFYSIPSASGKDKIVRENDARRRQRRLTVFPRADKLSSRDFYIFERWVKGALHGQNDATARSCRMDRQFENIQWKKGD